VTPFPKLPDTTKTADITGYRVGWGAQQGFYFFASILLMRQASGTPAAWPQGQPEDHYVKWVHGVVEDAYFDPDGRLAILDVTGSGGKTSTLYLPHPEQHIEAGRRATFQVSFDGMPGEFRVLQYHPHNRRKNKTEAAC
jgi:hypothetical protein